MCVVKKKKYTRPPLGYNIIPFGAYYSSGDKIDCPRVTCCTLCHHLTDSLLYHSQGFPAPQSILFADQPGSVSRRTASVLAVLANCHHWTHQPPYQRFRYWRCRRRHSSSRKMVRRRWVDRHPPGRDADSWHGRCFGMFEEQKTTKIPCSVYPSVSASSFVKFVRKSHGCVFIFHRIFGWRVFGFSPHGV